MATLKSQLRDVSYAQYLYRSVVGALLVLAVLIGIGVTRTSLTKPDRSVSPARAGSADAEITASVR